MLKRVRVKDWTPPGHVRTPWYLRGKIGEIERQLGPFGNPEVLAYGRAAPQMTMYRVRFTMAEVWGEAAEAPGDILEAEIYEHWLEPVAG